MGRVYSFEDLTAYFEPHADAAARQMRTCHVPIWDEGAWSGQPLLGDPQIGILYPPNWLWMIVPSLQLFAWLQLFHVLIGAAGMFWVVRRRGASEPAAALAALSLGLGAFMVLETRHCMFIASTAWLPWILWSVEAFSQDRKSTQLATLGGATALAILAGGWSMLIFGVAVVAACVIARVVKSPKVAVAVGGAALIGIATAAVQILPVLSHAALSPRGRGVAYEMASSYAWPSLRYLITLLFPTIYGTGDHYGGVFDQWEICGYAIGAIATVLSLFSVFSRRRQLERVLLFCLTLIAIDLACGKNGFLHPRLFRLSSLFGSLRCPARALYIWSMCGPLLAADGFDAVAEWIRKHAPRFERVMVALVALSALELLVTWRGENPSVRYSTLAEREPAIANFRRELGSERLATDVHLPQYFHNAGLSWGIESSGGYSSLPIWRYLHFLWIANHGAVYPHERIASDLSAQGLWKFSSRLIDLLDVGWLIAPRDRPPTDSKFVRAGSSESDPAGPIDLWRNTRVLPRAFVVDRAILVADENAAALAIAEPDFNPATTAIVEGATKIPGRVNRGTDSPALFQHENPHASTIQIDMHAPGLLVVSEPWYPGWKAFVDGAPTEILHVDYALSGLSLPAGRHQVRLEFKSRPLAVGGALSLVGILLLLTLCVIRRPCHR